MFLARKLLPLPVSPTQPTTTTNSSNSNKKKSRPAPHKTRPVTGTVTRRKTYCTHIFMQIHLGILFLFCHSLLPLTRALSRPISTFCCRMCVCFIRSSQCVSHSMSQATPFGSFLSFFSTFLFSFFFSFKLISAPRIRVLHFGLTKSIFSHFLCCHPSHPSVPTLRKIRFHSTQPTRKTMLSTGKWRLLVPTGRLHLPVSIPFSTHRSPAMPPMPLPFAGDDTCAVLLLVEKCFLNETSPCIIPLQRRGDAVAFLSLDL